MTIAEQISTGKLIEAQSKASEADLLANAVANGYAANDVRVRIVSQSEFRAILARVHESETTYQDRRRREYPSVGDQLDDLYQRGAFSPEMTAKIKAVKDQFPKHGMPPLLFDTLKPT